MTVYTAEISRITRGLAMILDHHNDFVMEAPDRIHDRGVDDGHGLGGPPLSQAFLTWLAAGGVCVCEPNDEGVLRHYCSTKPRRFRESDKRSHKLRMRRALRQLREIAPAEFDIVYLFVARGYSLTDVRARIDASRSARGLDPFTDLEFAAMVIAGCDKFIYCY